MLKKTLLFAATLAVSAMTLADKENQDLSNESSVSRAMAAQRSGELASEQDQHLSGKVRAASYKRYVDSFAHPIPQSFIDTGFTNEK